MASDVVMACAHLVDRTGASGFEIGYTRDDVPTDEAGWYAMATYRGARIMVDEHRSPTTAAMALAERLLSGATCRCRKPVSMSDDQPGCRWRLVGKAWEPGCDAPPIAVEGRAMAEPNNRAERRGSAAKHYGWRGGR